MNKEPWVSTICSAYRPFWKAVFPLRTWICFHISVDDDETCECSDTTHWNKKCPWQGHPDKEREFDLFGDLPRHSIIPSKEEKSEAE